MTETHAGPVEGTARPDLAERRFQVAVEGSPSGILLADRSGRIVMVNRHVEKLFGYSREELVGEPVEKLIPSRYRAGHVAHREGFFHSPEMRPMGIGRDLAGVRKDGSEFPVEIGLNPLETEEGPMVLASIVDITGQRSLQRRLEHTERLTALGQLAAGVAHEINTPLANISLVAQVVRRRSEDPWLQQKMDSILAQVDASARIVKGLLDFSSRRDPVVGSVDVAGLVRETIDFVRAKVPPDVHFSFDPPGKKLLALGDASQLRQVLTNLYLNASDAMEGRGTIVTTISEQRSEQSAVPRGPVDEWVAITVIDTGPGIPAESLAHIFDPFFTTKSDTGGTGLGLSVVHGIVRSLGGRIEASNSPAGGACFRVSLLRALA